MTYIKKTQQLFEHWAENGRAEGMERGHSTRAAVALERIPLKDGDRVLDLGCGNGWATRWLRAQLGPSGTAVGTDVADAMLARAETQSANLKGVSFRNAAFEELPWEDNTFDHAFSMEAIYYAPDVPAALRSIRRVLRPGGTFTICIDFFEENPYSAPWPEMLDIEMKRLSQEGWVKAFKQAGFVVDEAFRCFDPRPVEDDLPEWEREERVDFRTNIGSLAVRGRVPAGDNL